jgi:hypothetical protein
MVLLEKLGKLEKLIDYIGTRTRDLSVCSIAPQSSTTSRKVTGSSLDEVIVFFFFKFPNPSSRTMALGLNEAPSRKVDSLTAICEPIV